MEITKLFTVDYFIKKFEAIPEPLFIKNDIGTLGGPRCANGHCLGMGSYSSDEGEGLKQLFLKLKVTFRNVSASYLNADLDNWGYSRIAEQINNGNAIEYQQPTPKQRILAALYDIKKMQEPIEQDAPEKPQESIRYVTVKIDEQVQKLTKNLVFN